ncbi:MAG TPA: Rieske (2Fe-2S) protein [Kofleriaceae bacterium]|nr:Rieske (2Fe-2S) protein [Kofleriaceae bacterium]
MSLRVFVDRPAATECHGCSRRAVLQGFAVTAASLLVGCPAPEDPIAVDAAASMTTSMCGSNLCLDLNDPANSALTMVDGSLTVTAPKDKILVMRTSPTVVQAVSDICTHAGCDVFYDQAAMAIECPCHGSRYSVTGTVLRGPATRPLRSYPAVLDATTNIVTITI